MAQISYALITTVGAQKIAAALAAETSINLVSIAIGSGVTAPSGGETALYSEVARKSISGQGVVAGALNTLYADIYLAAADGPYTITEAGLFDDTGTLIAIARVNPAINKPTPDSGQVVEGTLRIQIQVANATAVSITVDPSMAVALQRLSVLPWIPVLSVTAAAPPASPVLGDTYVIPTGATGSWAGHANKVAEFTVAGWAIITPRNGVGVGLPDGRVFMRLAGVFTELTASETRRGLVELATNAEALAGADSGRALTPRGATEVRRKMEYVTAGGAANALTVTLDPAPTALYVGMSLRVRCVASNTGPVTLNVNGLGAENVSNSNAPFTMQAGAIPATAILDLVYAGGSGWFAVGGLQATAGSLGDVRLASNPEAQAGTDTEKALTAANLSSRTATETRTGLAELATAAEALAGTDGARIVTPAGALEVRRRSDLVLTDGGTASAMTATMTPAPSSIYEGLSFKLRVQPAQSGNTGAVTLNLNGLGAKALVPATSPFVLTGGEIEPNSVLDLVYQGAAFVIVSGHKATETNEGIVELATSAETIAGTDAGRAVTPAGLASRTATETRTGLVELATGAETRAGVDAARGVTPAGLFAARSAIRAPETMRWSTPGTYNWPVPADVTRIYGIVTSAGGGGGGQKATGIASGGGGGGRAEGSKTVTPGQVLTITVGAGGAGGLGSNTTADPTNGLGGGSSSIGSLLSASGAGGGIAAAAGIQGSSGAQGVGTGGDINRAGFGGGTGFSNIGGQGGGLYGTSGSPLNSGAQGQPGYGPGGGGSGASGGGTNGGAGADGEVIIQY